jgi:hypothetical protein
MRKKPIVLPKTKTQTQSVVMVRVPKLLKDQIENLCERLDTTQQSLFLAAIVGYMYDVEKELAKKAESLGSK